MSDFVRAGSIVRRIWGDVDVIMLVFAGSAAEFGLNKAVDWLFVTGDLPRDPIGRFFSTAAYARRIAFGSTQEAERAFAAIRGAHAGVEKKRGAGRIPDWAHRDVLYMLIDHSERAYQALYRPLTPAERDDLYDVFYRIGIGLGIPDLPKTYEAWLVDRERHLQNDLAVSELSRELDRSYQREVGWWRMVIVRQLQAVLSPPRVVELLDLPRRPWIRPLLGCHSTVVKLGLRGLAQRLLVPVAHLGALRALEQGRRPVPASVPDAAPIHALDIPSGSLTSSPQQVDPAEVDQDELREARKRLSRNAQHFAAMSLFMIATVASAAIRKGAWLPKYWIGLTAALITALIAYRLWKQYRAQDV